MSVVYTGRESDLTGLLAQRFEAEIDERRSTYSLSITDKFILVQFRRKREREREKKATTTKNAKQGWLPAF